MAIHFSLIHSFYTNILITWHDITNTLIINTLITNTLIINTLITNILTVTFNHFQHFFND